MCKAKATHLKNVILNINFPSILSHTNHVLNVSLTLSTFNLFFKLADFNLFERQKDRKDIKIKMNRHRGNVLLSSGLFPKCPQSQD